MSEFPRERSCDIAGAGHSIPSGISAMKPAGSLKVQCKVKWLKDEKFSVVIDGAIVTMRHHNPERLRAVLDSSRLESTQIHPKYELLMVKLSGARYALRFYLTSGELEPCSLGSYIWAVRKRKLRDEYLDFWE